MSFIKKPLVFGLITALPALFVNPLPAKAWTNFTNQDAMSDQPDQMAMQTADGYSASDPNAPTLIIACVAGDLRMLVNYGPGVFLGFSPLQATLRWGETPPYTEQYAVSDSGQSVFLYDESADGDGIWGPELLVIDTAAHSPKPGEFLAVRVFPTGADPITAKFEIKGFDAAYAPIGKQCHLSFSEALK